MPKIKIKGKMLSSDVAGLGITYSNNKINIKINSNSGLTFSSDGTLYLQNVVTATSISNSTNKSINITDIDEKGRIIGYTISNYDSFIKINEKDSPTQSIVSNFVLPNNSTGFISDGIYKINLFNGKRPITRNFLSGYNPNTEDINEFLESVFYPSVPPTLSLSTPTPTKEFGSNIATTLQWSVTKQTYGISTIKINSTFISVPPNISSDSSTIGTVVNGSVILNATQNVSTVFTLSVTDTKGNVFNTSITVSWGNKRYWGKVDLSSINNPDLTLFPNLVYQVANVITDNLILNLDGAGVGTGNEIAFNRNKTYINMNGVGDYLIFAYPSSFGSPTFTVNGLASTAFTNIWSSVPFTNSNGYIVNYDVWISNTAQPGSIDSIIIS